jgi:hypothetical protein
MVPIKKMNNSEFHGGPGYKSLAMMLSLLAVGFAGAGVSLGMGESWFAAAFSGFFTAGLLGLSGWWCIRKALASPDGRVFLRYTLGGIGVRFLLCGVLAGVVVGARLLDAEGFITGLLVGIAVFISIEVGSLALSKRLVPREGG